MKKTSYLIISLLLIIGSCFYANARETPTLFNSSAQKQMEKAPKDALNEANNTLDKALKQHDSPAVVAALIKGCTAQALIDQDSIPALIKRAERIADQSTNPVEQSMIRLYTAHLYIQFFRYNYQIAGRDDINDFSLPMEAWSMNMVSSRIDTLITQALAPAKALQATPIKEYAQALEIGSDIVFRPTLYDFVIAKAIDLYQLLNNNTATLPHLDRCLKLIPTQAFLQESNYDNRILQLYAEALKAYAHNEMSAPFMMWDLQRVKYLAQDIIYTPIYTSPNDEYIAEIVAMLYDYQSLPYSVEIADFVISQLQRANTHDTLKQALDLCDEWIAQYPDYSRISLLKNKRNNILTKTLSIKIPGLLYPGKSQSVQVSYRNIKEYTINIYRQPDTFSLQAQEEDSPQNDKWSRSNRVASITSPTPDGELSLITRKGSIEIPALTPGYYVVEMLIEGVATNDVINLSVSSVKTIVRNAAPGIVELLAVDAQSGKPLSNAEVKVYTRPSYYYSKEKKEEKLQRVLQTDKQGLCTLKVNQESRWYAKAAISGDSFSPAIILSYPYLYQHNEKEVPETVLFTDRSVYRPGQTVYFSGIRYINTFKTNRVISEEKVTVSLHDASGNAISSIQLTTDEYGQFNGSFVIPRGLLLGSYYIEVNNQYISSGEFSVEEYKLPMFKVEFDPLKEGGKFDRPLTITGTANSYSGIAQTGATVEYTILKQNNPYRWSYSHPEQIEVGTTTVDASGAFEITFTPQRDTDTNSINKEQAYIYTIRATVTAPTGESVEESTSVVIGDSPYFVSVTAPKMIDKYQSAGKIKSQVLTLNGDPVKRERQLVFYSLYDSDQTQELDSLKIKMQVGEVTIPANGTALYPDFTTWASGPYRIVAFSSDEEGRIIQGECNFILYSNKDKSPAQYSTLWLPRKQWNVETDETVDIAVGSSCKDAYLFYSIYSSEQLLETKLLKLNNSCKTIPVKFDNRFKGLATINFLIVKEGEVTTATATIRPQEPNRELTITTSSFRDKLIPGSTEQWTFSVTDAEGNPVTARFMTEMFDASMHSIRPHDWDFNPKRPKLSCRLSTTPSSLRNYNRPLYLTSSVKSLNVPPETKTSFIYSYFMENYPFYIYGYRASYNRVAHTKAETEVARRISSDSMNDAIMEEAAMDEVVTIGYETVHKQAKTGSIAQGTSERTDSYRTEEAGTAFFYPTLTTDSLGRASLSFTVPNENTTWQFFALAYTQNLFAGEYEAQTVSSKPIMVSPNLPRFVRQGDEVSIATAVQNRTEEAQEGNLLIELFDPYTHAMLNSRQVTFLIDAGQSQTIDYRFTAPSGKSVIGFRVKASTAQHSDGEQQILPVLPTQVFVTDSQPFFIPSNTDTTIVTLPGMEEKMQSSTPESYRMTLQYCNNPAWYAVQALPSLTEPSSDNAISIMASLYANSVASKLANDNPRIAQAIQAWKAAGGTNLTSPLNQNEELKQILLSATPWVLDATNETEQMQQLATLFDKNRANTLIQAAIRKLGNLQAPNGGLRWFSGMAPSLTTSLNTLEGFSRMQALGIELNNEIKTMQIELIHYVDNEIVRQWKEYKGIAPQSLTYTDVVYLYVRSAYRDIPLAGETLTIHQEMMKRLKSWSNFNDYEKAYAALALHRYGFTAEAQAIINSLRQYAVTTPDKGMFWPNSRSSYFYQNGAVQKECALFHAFAEVNPVTAELDAMRQWLLTQKQTNQWASVPSTLDAISALLTQGTDWFAADQTPATITWGGKSLKVNPDDAFTGVSEYTRNGSEITPADTQVVITTDHAQPSWGALYWQYYNDVKNVESASVKDLDLHRQLFVRKQTNETTTYVPLNTTSIKPGDRIAVRLTITVGQDMQFVCLTDNRAACFEPASSLSGYKYRERIGYYEEIGNTETRFYFEFLPKGTYVITYELNVDRQGEYTQGLSTIQCLYAPQMIARSAAQTIIVK